MAEPAPDPVGLAGLPVEPLAGQAEAAAVPVQLLGVVPALVRAVVGTEAAGVAALRQVAAVPVVLAADKAAVLLSCKPRY